MRIIDTSHMAHSVARIGTYTLRSDGTSQTGIAILQEEHVLEARVNGSKVFRATCSPDNIGEMVAGRLLSDGVVRSAKAIDTVRVPEDGKVVEVALTGDAAWEARSPVRVTSCDSATSAYADFFCGAYEPDPIVPIEWKAGDIRAIVDAFSQDTPMHSKSSGVHSAYLALGGEILYCCEDLGRHNALDKVIGCAMRDDVDLGACTVMTSGRVPVDMMSKVIQARIPIFVSKSIPTRPAVELARAWGVTLICRAWPDSFDIYNDAWGEAGKLGTTRVAADNRDGGPQAVSV